MSVSPVPLKAPDVAMMASSNRVRIFIVTIFGLCVLTASFVILISAVRPDDDNIALITIVVGIFAPIVTALLAAALKENHDAMNSRLTQLLELTAKASKAEGELGVGGAAHTLQSIDANTAATAANTNREVKP